MDTKGEKSTQGAKPQQTGPDHPDRYARDLNPDRMAGQNTGPVRQDREVALATAADHKALHQKLQHFTNDELRQIPVLQSGARLEQGATYANLAEENPSEFRAVGHRTTEPGEYWVPKDRTPYTIWNRLIGEPRPGQAKPGTGDRAIPGQK